MKWENFNGDLFMVFQAISEFKEEEKVEFYFQADGKKYYIEIEFEGELFYEFSWKVNEKPDLTSLKEMLIDFYEKKIKC